MRTMTPGGRSREASSRQPRLEAITCFTACLAKRTREPPLVRLGRSSEPAFHRLQTLPQRDPHTAGQRRKEQRLGQTGLPGPLPQRLEVVLAGQARLAPLQALEPDRGVDLGQSLLD